MKYYLIVGEASGDLHASHLMSALRKVDASAEFRFLGGDLMSAVGGTRVRHYKELAYMGFAPVLLHLRTILRNREACKRDIVAWQPDAVILVDYPGFNLNIAQFVHANTNIPVYYYISPKIWAWKEYRIKNIKRDVDKLFSILPFEVDFFEGKHQYHINYVGNPTAAEVREFLAGYHETFDEFVVRQQLQPGKRIIALLAGSRRQEIKDNLPAMLEATVDLAAPDSDCQLVIAGAPSIDPAYYDQVIAKMNRRRAVPIAAPRIVWDSTYPLLAHATAALVTSGTATLETALFNVPQVVCYETPVPCLIRWAFNHIIKCKYISLVNLVADREIVQELLADRFTVDNISTELHKLLPGQSAREDMLQAYREVQKSLGDEIAPENAARLMYQALTASL